MDKVWSIVESMDMTLQSQKDTILTLGIYLATGLSEILPCII